MFICTGESTVAYLKDNHAILDYTAIFPPVKKKIKKKQKAEEPRICSAGYS